MRYVDKSQQDRYTDVWRDKQTRLRGICLFIRLIWDGKRDGQRESVNSVEERKRIRRANEGIRKLKVSPTNKTNYISECTSPERIKGRQRVIYPSLHLISSRFLTRSQRSIR